MKWKLWEIVADKATTNWGRLRPFLAPYRGAIGILALVSVLSGVAEAAVLVVLAESAEAVVSDRLVAKAEFGPLSLEGTVLRLLAIAAAIVVVRLGLQIVAAIVPARAGASLQARVRDLLFLNYSSAWWPRQEREREGHLQELMTSHTLQVSGVVLQAANLIAALAIFLTLLTSAFVTSAYIASTVIVFFAMLFLLLRPISIRARRYSSVHSDAHIKYSEKISETVRLSEEFQTYDSMEVRRYELEGLSSEAKDAFYKMQVAGRLVPSLYQSAVLVLLVIGLVALYLLNLTDIGKLGAVVLMVLRAGAYGQQIQGSYHTLSEFLPYAERLRTATESYATHQRPVAGQNLDEIHRLELVSVHYCYPAAVEDADDAAALFDVSLEMNQGESLGLVGPSGGGKSTIASILLRLRLPSRGAYLVNGIDAEDIDLSDWRKLVSYVPQVPKLMTGSLADNVRFGRKGISPEAVATALEFAGLWDDMRKWRNGIDEPLSQNSVSGGQRQRICIARAIAGNPSVIILDEPTSSLDHQAERRLLETLERLRGSMTMCIIAHRPDTMRVCDRIAVVREGRVVDVDTMPALRRHNDFVRAMLTGQRAAEP